MDAAKYIAGLCIYIYNVFAWTTWAQIDYSLFDPTLFCSVACPSGKKFFAWHDGGLADLIILLKCAYTEWECPVLCDPKSSKCCEVLWSKTQRSIVMDRSCKKDIDVPQIVCTHAGKKRKCAIAYYCSKINFKKYWNSTTNQSFTLIYEILSQLLLQHQQQINQHQIAHNWKVI